MYSGVYNFLPKYFKGGGPAASYTLLLCLNNVTIHI